MCISVGDLTEDQIVDLGSILQGFSPSDIGQMDRVCAVIRFCLCSQFI